MVEQFFQFGLVGLSGLFIDFGITWILKERIYFNTYIANGSGFLAAATSNYILNRVWTFSSVNPNIALEYLSFLLISIVGLAINSLILYILVDKTKFTLNSPKLKFYLSKLVATAVVTIWNFFMNLLFTFS